MGLLTLFNLAQAAYGSIYSQLGNSRWGGICMSGQDVPILSNVFLAQVVDVTPTAWSSVAEQVPVSIQQERSPEKSHTAAQNLSLTATWVTTIQCYLFYLLNCWLLFYFKKITRCHFFILMFWSAKYNYVLWNLNQMTLLLPLYFCQSVLAFNINMAAFFAI